MQILRVNYRELNFKVKQEISNFANKHGERKIYFKKNRAVEKLCSNFLGICSRKFSLKKMVQKIYNYPIKKRGKAGTKSQIYRNSPFNRPNQFNCYP